MLVTSLINKTSNGKTWNEETFISLVYSYQANKKLFEFRGDIIGYK